MTHGIVLGVLVGSVGMAILAMFGQIIIGWYKYMYWHVG